MVLSKTNIIIIAASAGGVVVLSVLLVLIGWCGCNRLGETHQAGTSLPSNQATSNYSARPRVLRKRESRASANALDRREPSHHDTLSSDLSSRPAVLRKQQPLPANMFDPRGSSYRDASSSSFAASGPSTLQKDPPVSTLNAFDHRASSYYENFDVYSPQNLTQWAPSATFDPYAQYAPTLRTGSETSRTMSPYLQTPAMTTMPLRTSYHDLPQTDVHYSPQQSSSPPAIYQPPRQPPPAAGASPLFTSESYQVSPGGYFPPVTSPTPTSHHESIAIPTTQNPPPRIPDPGSTYTGVGSAAGGGPIVMSYDTQSANQNVQHYPREKVPYS